MKELLCYVEYRFTGNPSGILKKRLEKEFMEAYNKYVAICNDGLTEKLNKEFFEMYPDKDDVLDDPTYNYFMAGNYNKYAASKVKSPFMHFYVDPEEVQLIGVVDADPAITMEMFIKLKKD